MSQITIENFRKYSQVVMGWDPGLEVFFFYCLFSFDDDDPDIWEPHIVDIDLFENIIEKAGIYLPLKVKNRLIEHSKQNSQEILGYCLEKDILF